MWTYYRSIICISHSLTITTVLFFMDRLCDIVLMSSLLIGMFVSDIFRIFGGSSQICSWYNAPTWTPLATDLPQLPNTLSWHMHFTEKWQTFMLCRSLSKCPLFCTATISASLASMWMTRADWSFLVMLIKLLGRTCFVQVVLYIVSCPSKYVQTAWDKISDQHSCCIDIFKFTAVAAGCYGDRVFIFLLPSYHKHCCACTRLCTNFWLSIYQSVLTFPVF